MVDPLSPFVLSLPDVLQWTPRSRESSIRPSSLNNASIYRKQNAPYTLFSNHPPVHACRCRRVQRGENSQDLSASVCPQCRVASSCRGTGALLAACRHDRQHQSRYAGLYPYEVSQSLFYRSVLVSKQLSFSWEQGTAAGGVLEYDEPKYSVFADNPFQNNGHVPVAPLQFALSAVVRQASDGRLSQVIGDGLDAASLDGASAGPAVLLGTNLLPCWFTSRAQLLTTRPCFPVQAPLPTSPLVRATGRQLLRSS